MAKTKVAYVCSDCGADFPKWQGRCYACGAWNILSEFRTGSSASGAAKSKAGGFSGYAGSLSDVQTLSEIDLTEMPRMGTGVEELDRVLLN